MNFGLPHTDTHPRKVLAVFVANIELIFPSLYKCVVRLVPMHDTQTSGFSASLESPPVAPRFTRKMDERFEMPPLSYTNNTCRRRFNNPFLLNDCIAQQRQCRLLCCQKEIGQIDFMRYKSRFSFDVAAIC